MNDSRPPSTPVVISFCCGDQYYFDAAEQLRRDCASHGLDSDIVELKKEPDQTWIDICRRKIPFYLEMQRKHERAVLWVDVDSRIARFPEMLRGATCDVAGFLRGLRYLSGFDPLSVSRFFSPFALYFNNTPRTRAFLEFMAKLERETDVAATDDYFLQEAWERFDQQLTVMVLPPEQAHLPDWPETERQWYYHGKSGNVSEFKDKARQHKVEVHSPQRRKAVLMFEGMNAWKARKIDDSLLLYRKALEIDPKDDALAQKIARIMRREGKLKDALRFLRRHQGDNFLVNHARRFLADSELEAGKYKRAESVARDLVSSGSPSDRAWAQSRLLRIGLERRAAARRLSPEERTALWWMEGPHPGNFGDILNPYIVEKLSGIPPRFAPRGKGLLAIGSVIKFATEGTNVWGSGTPRMSDRLHPKAVYRAVRGPLTRRLVLESGGACPEIYGDPASFLPSLYKPRTSGSRANLGLITHHSNETDLQAAAGVKVISVIRAGYEGIEQFIDELCQCEQVLTTSLHGLIVAHAYGIPARWCEVPDSDGGVPGDGTKFHDYMLSVGMEPEPPLLLPRGSVVTVELAREADRLPPGKIDLAALAAAAPFEVTARWAR